MNSRSGRVQGKVALVTGAGGGIGAACAIALAREGASVAVADIDLSAAGPGLIITPATKDSYASSGVADIMLRHHLTPRLGEPEDIANR